MITFFRQAFILAAKDTRIFWRDRFGLALAFLFPLLFAFAFSHALKDGGAPDATPRLTVVAQEKHGVLREISAGLAASGWAVDERTRQEALDAVENGKIEGFLLFPEGFGTSVATGGEARIHVVVSGNHPGAAAVLQGAARAIGSRVETLALAARAVGALEPARPPDAEAMLEALRLPPLTSLEMTRTGQRRHNPANFTLPGYLTMFVFFAAALGAGAIVRERQNRTLERLMSTGVRASSILVGKFLSGASRGVAQLTVLWTVGVLGLSMDLGASPGAVVVVSLLFVLVSAAFGVMLAAMVDNLRGAATIGVFTSLTLAPLGGCWWPLFIAPEWLQVMARLTPHGWANDAFNRLMLFGASASDVAPAMLALVMFAFVFGAIALLRFRFSPPI